MIPHAGSCSSDQRTPPQFSKIAPMAMVVNPDPHSRMGPSADIAACMQAPRYPGVAPQPSFPSRRRGHVTTKRLSTSPGREDPKSLRMDLRKVTFLCRSLRCASQSSGQDGTAGRPHRAGSLLLMLDSALDVPSVFNCVSEVAAGGHPYACLPRALSVSSEIQTHAMQLHCT